MSTRTPMLLPRWSRQIRLIHSSSIQFQEPRVNQVGIQYLSHDLHKKIFTKHDSQAYKLPHNQALLDLSKRHLEHFELLGKKTQLSDPINITHFPELVGKNTLDEHFYRIGSRYADPYKKLAQDLFEKEQLPQIPKSWVFQSGWTRYAPGEQPTSVPFPLEDDLVFDVEVLYKITNFPALATAASSAAWYGWVSPALMEEDLANCDWNHLIPFDTHKKPKLMVGYNVSYDRARVMEEYNLKQSKAFFLDAMALHVATSGFCSQQRPLWFKHRKTKNAVETVTEDDTSDSLSSSSDMELSAQDVAQELSDDPWLNKGAPNSLASAAEFHCGILMDKDARDFFSSTDPEDITENFQLLMEYCAKDVDATFHVARKLYPEFLRRNPHPVSFAALKSLGSLFLPTTSKWDDYLENAQDAYEENREQVTEILTERVDELIRYIQKDDESLKPDHENDPWLKQLDWTMKLPRLKKDGTPTAKQAYMINYPEWYRDLFKTTNSDTGEREINLTVRSRITPLLLRLKWEGQPLIWTDSAGWCFKVPNEDNVVEEMLEKNYTRAKLSTEDLEKFMPELRDDGNNYELFKVPHPEGPKKRCTSIMSKSYQRYFDNGVLTSQYDFASEILKLNATASYWMGNRTRITDQFVVYADEDAKKNNFFDTKKEAKAHKGLGMIIPKLCSMGTVTRRATENTWLTASNSKTNRIGSELKAMIQAPPGYSFVGADVDSEELWIASLIGDSMFKIHGGTALGWMTLEGDKNEKTDLHSKTAEIMGISRNDAKVFNYGRIYGAGVKFATQLLKQCNVNLDDATAEKKAQELYKQTKGMTSYSRTFDKRTYHGGTESVMFNALESIAYQDSPKTPVLGASITDALTKKHLNKNSYLTSRVNWTIQSSGVDYLHLLIVSMDYLIEKFKIDARLMITVHDELRYMVKEEQRLQCALLLQISNVWTRAMFCEQLGIKELPQACAFFSEVDVDFILRKEVTMDCVTPSQPTPMAAGESYDIRKLLDSFDAEKFLEGKSSSLQTIRSSGFTHRTPVIDTLDDEPNENLKVARLRLQNSFDKKEWTENMTKYLTLHRQVKSGAKSSISKERLEKAASKKQDFPKPSKSASKATSKPLSKKTVKKAEALPSASGNTKKSLDKPKPPKRKRALEEFSLSKDGDDLLEKHLNELPERKVEPGKVQRSFPSYSYVSKPNYQGDSSLKFNKHMPGHTSPSGSSSSYHRSYSYTSPREEHSYVKKRMSSLGNFRFKPRVQPMESKSLNESLTPKLHTTGGLGTKTFNFKRNLFTAQNQQQFKVIEAWTGSKLSQATGFVTALSNNDARDDNFRRRGIGTFSEKYLFSRGRRRPQSST